MYQLSALFEKHTSVNDILMAVRRVALVYHVPMGNLGLEA